MGHLVVKIDWDNENMSAMRQMKLHVPMLAAVTLATAPVALQAQPADLPILPATTSEYPKGVAVRSTEAGPVYTDVWGHTLYGLDLRTVQRWSPDAAQYCATRCEEWEPLLAPADSTPNVAYPAGFGPGRREWAAKMAEKGYYSEPGNAPDWTIIEGPAGLQWVYKGWHMVYTRKGDPKGSTRYDGADEFKWNTLKFIPPVPEVVAPEKVEPLFVDGSYALSVGGEQLLFTGACTAECNGWAPFAAGLASRGIGDWQVNREHDVAQWTYRGARVFVASSGEGRSVPEGANVVRP